MPEWLGEASPLSRMPQNPLLTAGISSTLKGVLYGQGLKLKSEQRYEQRISSGIWAADQKRT